MTQFSIRPARGGDEPIVLSLLRALAEYEKLLDKFHIDESVIRRDYLSERPLIHCELLYAGDTAIGIATWYWAYASFAAKRVVFLEDLFMLPASRGSGGGKKLLAHLARIAIEAGADGVEWRVLPWNKPTIDIYERIGAKHNDEWLVYYLSGDALKRLGA